MEILFFIGMVVLGVGFAMFLQWRNDKWYENQLRKKYGKD